MTMTTFNASQELNSLYQVEPGDAICGHSCFRPEGHEGEHMTYDQYEAFLLAEIAAQPIVCPTCGKPSANPLRDGRCIVCELLQAA